MKQLKYTAAEIDERLGRVDKLSNPNLLINHFFQINQRGQSSYSDTTNAVDCWTLRGGGSSFNVTSGALVLASNYGHFGELVENYSRYMGKRFTATFDIESFSGDELYVYCYDGVNNNRTQIQSTGITSCTFTLAESATQLLIAIQNRSLAVSATCKPVSAKLELGSISTLANDAAPKIATDLAECQRYFRLWKTEAARTAALNEVGLMRLASPTLGTISIGGTTYYTASAEL